MKKLIILLIAGITGTSVHAQFLDRIKNRVQQKVNEKVDRTIDQTIDKATEPKKKPVQTGDTPTDGPVGNQPDITNGNGTTNVGITAYSRFDFVPGETIIMQESFEQDAVGDFPGQWNTRSGAELVTVSNRPGKWLALKQDGIFYPEYVNKPLPDNFTLQLDVMAHNNIASISELTISLLNAASTDEKFDNGAAGGASIPAFKIQLNPKSSGYGTFSYYSSIIGSNSIGKMPEFHVPEKNTVRVSIWRQQQRVRVYLDSTKILDLPRALEAGARFNSLVFGAYAPNFDNNDGAFFISNIRLAVGAADTRNKLLTTGKFVTHGILFDPNSDYIKPESYGALKDIAAVLTENPAVRVRIVGHTDADGNDQLNLDLSKRRAAAVKAALGKTFSIAENRLETDGKGKTQPLGDNTTTVGKANNRRVEFIKL
ncbi:OmpA family protein [Chitinophaga nivalis]|uniref:OmpA family protein n=1 Tax=Chitinophaga nivalis TaxID=2991709 RepID=A0ABT3IGV6_9BACT|nr:OmpA family protein [Chitinophaga nivalis]MCW3467106.1 OmpA family protein [Chitinophaga nivalis]MCW3483203.1 OmpA family protein [Chitinophaga nivalis]